MAHDVFISHSAQNREVADAVCAALEKAAIRCWVAPRDVRPGRSFPGEITRAIQQSKVMLLIFSSHSNNSEQVLREVQLATDARLPIIRFRIEDVALTDDLKYFLSTPHWLDALTPPLSKHITRLELAIKELLGQSIEVTGKNVLSGDVPPAAPPTVAPAATPPVPSAVAPAMPPPLPMAPPAQKEREAVAPKSFNPWPLLALAAAAPITKTLSAVGSGPFASQADLDHALGFDMAGRAIPDGPQGSGQDWSYLNGVAQVTVEGASAVTTRWHDLRVEAWRATFATGGLDRAYQSPFATALMSVTPDGSLKGSVRVDGVRGVTDFWLVVTGVARDGQRDLIASLGGTNTSFTGSVLGWLTAP